MNPSAIRLAYLVSQYPVVHHRYILSEIRGLRDLGFDVCVISVNSPDRQLSSLDPDERDEAARTLYVKRAGVSGALLAHLSAIFHRPLPYLRGIVTWIRFSRFCPADLLRFFFYFTEALIAGRWICVRRLDHAHVHYASQVAIFLQCVFPVTVSHTFHGHAEFENPIAFHLTEKIEAARFVIAISHYARSQVLKHCSYPYWHKVWVCPLGVDLERFAGTASPRNSPFHLVTVGRLSPEKGHVILFAALEQIIRSGRQVKLSIIGDGPCRMLLEEAARRKGLEKVVAFHGGMNNDAVAAFYRRADAFVLASFAEGVPVVLMEAMAAGLPCVASRITGIPELIEDGRSGLLVTPADEVALTEALRRLYDDPELCARMAEAGRLQVAQKYDAAKNILRLADLFRTNI